MIQFEERRPREGQLVKIDRRAGLGALLIVAAVSLPGLAIAQANAPIPKPRPADRMPEGMEQAESLPEPAAAPLAAVAIAQPRTAAQAVEAMVATPQQVRLEARVTDSGGVIPNGLVWRVFETRTNTAGELAMAAKSDQATANFELAPGEYVVHVAYGRAQASDTLIVEEGGGSKSITLDAGALRLNAAITGDVGIPINLLRFDIFTDGAEGNQSAIAENLSANDLVTLNAGTYHIVSRFGTVTAEADLRVEPGEVTDATLYHRAAQVAFRLVTQQGGEAIAAVEWTVKAEDGSTVFEDLGAFPATVLAEGDYTVFAKQGEQVYNRAFEVTPGAPRDIEVLTTVY